MKFSFTAYIERDDDELEVSVTYDVTPFIEATYWQPAEGGEVELLKAVFVESDTLPAPLTDAEESKLIDECEERAGRDIADKAADYADYQYEQFKDRKMMDAWDSRNASRAFDERAV